MAKAKTYNPDAVKSITGLLQGNRHFNRLARKVANPVESLSRNMLKLTNIVKDGNTYGWNPIRLAQSKELFTKEVKGRTLKQIEDAIVSERDRNMAKAVDKSEEKIAEDYFKLRVQLEYQTLKFYTELFEEKKEEKQEKHEEAVAE